MEQPTRHAIPTIDFAPFLDGSPAEKQAVVDAIGDACQRYGFMSLVGHGVPRGVIDDALAAAAEFFALPDAEKRLVQDRRANRGFIPMFDSVSKDNKPNGSEAFSMGHPKVPADPELAALPFHSATPWPELPGFRPRIEASYAALFGLSESFLRAVALHLEAPEDFFAEAARDTYSNMRVIHYPPAEAVAEVTDVGVRPHFDEGLITLLLQDMNGGLSVLGPDEVWLPVVPNPDAIVVNVGKLLRHWTNGRFKAALHSVVNKSGRERYSMPLFVHPSFRTRVDPGDLVGEAPSDPAYEPIVAGERVYANFAAQRVSWKQPEPTPAA